MMLLDGRSAGGPLLLVLLLSGFGTNPTQRLSVPVILTAAPVYDAPAGLRGGERFPRGARLMLVENGAATPLVEGFAATADASISFDALRVLFAGKKSAADPWGIWELTLSDRSVREVIAGAQDAVRPMYLPGNRLVYARRTEGGFRIEAAGLDGTDVLPLSYSPGNALPDDVLRDGRILFESGFPLGLGTTPEMFLVYSDGSGVESYRCDHGTARWGGRQLASGDVVFTHGATLARFTSPLANEARVTAPHAEYAGEIAELASGDWLVSARPGPAAKYALEVWKPGTPALRMMFARAGEDLVEPVLVAPRQRPNKHPSGLHDWNYANLLALDARQSREGAVKGTPVTVRVQALDDAGKSVELGEAPVEADGSFFVQTPADRPIRFALLDRQGAVLRQERGWFWARRGEQRICVGCHTGPERASENRVPEVLLHSTTPVDLSGSSHQPGAEGH
jgi:hypothetical protein